MGLGLTTDLLLDTDHAIEFLKGNHKVANALNAAIQKGQKVFLTAPSLGELYEGALKARQPDRELQRINDLVNLLDGVLPFDASTALKFGEVMATLSGHGQTIPDIDAQIAATALVHGLSVISNDRHLRTVAKIFPLAVLSWR